MPSTYENQIEGCSVAGNRFQNNLISELSIKHTVYVLSYLSYEIDERIVEELQHLSGNTEYIYGRKSRVSSLARYRKAVHSKLTQVDQFISYNPSYAWLYEAVNANNRGVKSILILADYAPSKSCRGLLHKIYSMVQMHDIKRYKKVVGLSESSRDIVRKDQGFVCVEGGLARETFDYFSKFKGDSSKKRFMYAGTLKKANGVDLLLNAFLEYNDPESELWITGSGPLKHIIETYSTRDKRIIYFDKLEYPDYLEKLEETTVLINPRNMGFPENTYNFPSKIIEYLATGKTIISTKFPGWKRFEKHVIFCEDSIEGIKRAIIKAMQATEVEWRNRREYAQSFLWENQIHKILY